MRAISLFVFTIVVFAAACPPAESADDPASDARTDERLDDECQNDDDCPGGVSCFSGVCNTLGRSCFSESTCGQHFDCIDGFCGAPEDCDLPCCDNAGCFVLETCEGFECAPSPCADDLECVVVFGATDVVGCFSADDCPAGTDCADLNPTRCIEIADQSCEDSGYTTRLLITPDGVAMAACLYEGTCVDGGCN
jgi:hypothetical protein